MINDPKLLACVQRVRIRAELFLGLVSQLKDDLVAISKLADPDPSQIIDDSGLFPFDGGDWVALKSLFAALVQMAEDQQIQTMLKAAQVRPLDYILRTMPDRFYSHPQQETDPYRKVFFERIRPRCLVIRALRYVINDDKRILSRVLSEPSVTALADDETVNEYRSDAPPVTVGALRVYLGVLQQIIGGPVDSEEIAQAIDDACAGEELSLT